MPSTFRIPKAEITGLYGAMVRMFAKRMLGGEMPDNAYVYFHHQQVLKSVMSFEGKVKKWDALDPMLKSYAQLGAPAVVELTQMVALENMRSRFNSAAGLQSQGYSDVCELPLAVPSNA